MSYQPSAASPGERPCVDRWEAMRSILEQVPQPATLMDLGAAEGWFSAKASDLGFYVTAIEPRAGVLDVKTRFMHSFVGSVDGESLRQWPRHDVVLALSVLHHFEDWRDVLEQVRACRYWAIVEVPDPAEAEWMKMAKARHELEAIAEEVDLHSVKDLGRFERVGRNGATYYRPMHLLRGTVKRFRGRAFSGSGNNARSLRRFADERLTTVLGYEPFPGSLNLAFDEQPDLGPAVRYWARTIDSDRRAYVIWPAWIQGVPGHVMIPTARTAHPNTLEAWAPVKLRDRLGIKDGDVVAVDVQLEGHA